MFLAPSAIDVKVIPFFAVLKKMFGESPCGFTQGFLFRVRVCAMKVLQKGSLPIITEGGELVHVRPVRHPWFWFQEYLLAMQRTTIPS